MTYRYPTDDLSPREIRQDHTGALSTLALILGVCAVLMPGVWGALHMASDWYGAQATIHQEAFSSIRGNAGRASLNAPVVTVAEAR